MVDAPVKTDAPKPIPVVDAPKPTPVVDAPSAAGATSAGDTVRFGQSTKTDAPLMAGATTQAGDPARPGQPTQDPKVWAAPKKDGPTRTVAVGCGVFYRLGGMDLVAINNRRAHQPVWADEARDMSPAPTTDMVLPMLVTSVFEPPLPDAPPIVLPPPPAVDVLKFPTTDTIETTDGKVLSIAPSDLGAGEIMRDGILLAGSENAASMAYVVETNSVYHLSFGKDEVWSVMNDDGTWSTVPDWTPDLANKEVKDEIALRQKAAEMRAEAAGTMVPLPVVNGTVFLDGHDTFWAVGVVEGTAPGTWSWPPSMADVEKAAAMRQKAREDVAKARAAQVAAEAKIKAP
jgi:hypothetical protein